MEQNQCNFPNVGSRFFVGTKIIEARPLTANQFRVTHGRPGLAEDEPGYLVRYEDGYESWSPKKAFESAYKDCYAGMDFGGALFMLKRGHKVARKGWNGKNMWIVMMEGMKLPPFNSQEPGKKVNDRTAQYIGKDTPLETLPYIAMWTADGKWLPGWLASQTDMLAEDWVVVI